MVTSRDVGRAAGVSQATVSRVLSGGPVSEVTERRVRIAMDAVGYVPNSVARAMRTGQSRVIGVVVADLTNPFYPLMLEALAAAFRARDYRLTVWMASAEANDDALAAIRDRSVDGVVFTTATADSTELRSALDRGSPVVLVNRPLPGVDCDQVASDNTAGGALVARHLVDNARTRLGFIGGPDRASTSASRFSGFAAELGRMGVPLEQGVIVQGEYTYEDGRSGVAALLASGVAVDGLFCANDLLAIGAIDALRERGLRVPEDVWVIGYDDIPMASWHPYRLTTVRQDVTRTADVAAELLVARIEGGPRPSRTRLFAPELAVRASAAP